MNIVSNYRRRADGIGKHLDVHEQRVTEKVVLFFVSKLKHGYWMLSLPWILLKECLRIAWRETTQRLDDEATHEIACDQLMGLGPGPLNQKCTYNQQVG